jgi:hypothetical protein
MSCSRRRRITRPSLCAGIITVVTSQHYERPGRPRAVIGDTQGDLFRRPKGHYPEYRRVYPNIRAGLFRSIMPNPPARGILALQHGTLPSRLAARILAAGPVSGGSPPAHACRRPRDMRPFVRVAICFIRKGRSRGHPGVMGRPRFASVCRAGGLERLTPGII